MWQMFLINSSQEMDVLKRIEFFQSKELDFNLIYKGFSMPSFINKKKCHLPYNTKRYRMN